MSSAQVVWLLNSRVHLTPGAYGSLLARTQDRDGPQADYYLVNHCSSEGATVGI